MDKLLKKVVSGIDIKAIEKDAENGKYDANKMQKIIEVFLGKEKSDELMDQIRQKAESGEKISFTSILSLIKKNVDFSKLQEKVKSGEVNLDQMQSALNGLVGKEQTDRIFKEASEVANELDNGCLTEK